MHPSRLGTFRRAAALFAWAALLATPVSGILACPMPTDVAASEMEHAEHAEHAPDPAHHIPGAPDSPCPDVAHCIVAAVPATSRIVDGTVTPAPRNVSTPRAAPSAPERAVEPPPPRA